MSIQVAATANTKATTVSAGATSATAWATALEWLPPTLGIIASALGIVATIWLFWLSRKEKKQSIEKNKLEIQILKERLKNDHC
jgi:uncharacterized membrane protein YhiD involved in acid resistance